MAARDDPERRRSAGLLAGIAVISAALAVAIAFGVAGANDPGRIAEAVVALHDRGPTAGPPEVLPDSGVHLGFSVWARRVGWRPTGSREDRVEGRDVATAFWERKGKRIAHSVVSGALVGVPSRADRARRRGVLLRGFDTAGRHAAAWNEGGHTAVISAIGVSRRALYALAGGPVK